jgi:hypothetical protein
MLNLKRIQLVLLIVTLLPKVYADNTAFQQLPSKVVSTYEASIEARKQWLLSIMKPEFFNIKNPKFLTYDILGITALQGCGPKEYSEYMVKVFESAKFENSIYQINMFALPPLVRYLYQFGECLTAEQKTRIKVALSVKQGLLDHGTINHAMLRASSMYLLAQYFPDVKWYNRDDRFFSSTELMSALKELLLRRSNRFMRNGQYELLSPTYAMVNFTPLLNLIDFANDSEVKKLAELQAILQLSVLKVHSFDGVIVPPLARGLVPQKNSATLAKHQYVSVSQQILWYYYGIPNMGFNDLEGRKEPVYTVMLALSKWRPPESVLKLLENNATPYTIKIITPTFGIWDADTSPEIYGKAYITKNFAIGAGSTIFNPSNYNEATQLFSILYHSNAQNNQIECYQPYWKSNLGEDAWSTDHSSPFMQIYLGRTEGVMLFNIPVKDPWVFDVNNRFFKLRNEHQNSLYQLAQCRIPNSVDELVQEPNWVFARAGNTFIAMGTLFGENEYQDTTNKPNIADYKVFKIRQPKTAIYFKVAEKSPTLNFDRFIKMNKNKTLFFSPGQMKVTYRDEDHKIVEAQFQLDITTKSERVSGLPNIKINDVIQIPKSSPIIDSPFLILNNGKLTIKQNKIESNFNIPTDLIKTLKH